MTRIPFNAVPPAAKEPVDRAIGAGPTGTDQSRKRRHDDSDEGVEIGALSKKPRHDSAGSSEAAASGGSQLSGSKLDRIKKEAEERKQERRERDSAFANRNPPRNVNPDRRRELNHRPGVSQFYNLRGKSVVCYAYSLFSKEWYVGYSGGGSDVASGIAVKEDWWKRSDQDRRLNRVGPTLENVTQQTHYPPKNCAEVAALNVALSYDELVQNLIFIAFGGPERRGNIMSPCRNCEQWLVNSYGYFNRNGQFMPCKMS